MRHHRTLIAIACTAVLVNASAQNAPCPGEPLVFQLEDEYYGTKNWEHSTDGVTWSAVEVVENQPFILQPEQSGWYRVRFHDADCDINYVSEPQRFVAHPIDLGDAITLSIGGVVKNKLGGPVSGATVRAGCGPGVSTTTDHFGVFLLEDVQAYEGLAYVTVEKEGYVTGSRSFVPSENAGDAISYAYITLLQKYFAGTVQSVSGGQVTLASVTITFPPNGFEQNGEAYTGPVSVYLNRIDPINNDLHAEMPGMLMGVMDGDLQLMLSYGMVGVELADIYGQPVQLAPGGPATVRFPITAAQQADAPATIPLWWFDEDLGYWVHEGVAVRVGNEYVGEVAHFSWWNVDVPSNFVDLKGVVFENATGAVVPGSRIVVDSQTMGSGMTHADTQGEFTVLVPIGQQLTINVQLPCGPLGNWVTVHTEIAGPYTQPAVTTLSVSIPDQKLVTGTVVDCDQLPVGAGYVIVNGAPHFCVDGAFAVFTCAPSITIRGVDVATGNVSYYNTIDLVSDTTDLGDLVACTHLFGTVTDIDGNTYQTVLIGNQEWMSENLRTSTYSNGSTIPHVMYASVWSQYFLGAWCNYENSPDNDAIHGKLYNWWAAASSNNICPQGWHVPTDAEWTILMDYLGGTWVAGGKMKAVSSLWTWFNLGATNESGFSGLPSGRRDHWNGNFTSLGGAVIYWSSTAGSNGDYAWSYGLSVSNVNSGRYDIGKRAGHCVRCVRD
jgi:uncharacterized protein (TIGR02145 family)